MTTTNFQAFAMSMLPPQYALALTMARGAQRAGANLEDSRSHGLPFSEETVTEQTLLALKRSIPNLRIRSLTKTQEAQEGADWEFWVQGRQQWFSFLVQAKKAKAPRPGSTPTYDGGYTSGSNAGGTKQIDLLAKTARRKKMPAIYVLYNDPGLISESYVTPSCEAHIPAGVDGISVLPIQRMRWLLNKRKPWRPVPVLDARKYATPWSCLAACPAASSCQGWNAARIRDRAPWPADMSASLNTPEPQFLGFLDHTAEDDPAFLMARAIYLLQIRVPIREYDEERTDIREFKYLQSVTRSRSKQENGVSRSLDAPQYLPTLDTTEQDFAGLEETSDEPGLPHYVVAIWNEDNNER